jgi:acetyl esterase
MEIPTSAENGTGKVTLTLLRPKGSENEILPVAVYLSVIHLSFRNYFLD